MSRPSLPPALQPWAATLEALDLELAEALGPLVRALDALLGAGVPAVTPEGDRDGWGGIDRHGDPDRLLASEWLLADLHPEEFLRRAVASELLHLAPSFRDETPHGRVACILDVGPDQLGAARIVQLAAMVVLERRAARRGTDVRLGLATGPTVRWLDGSFAHAAHTWLHARSVVPPEPDAVRAALRGVADDGGAADEVWLVCGPALAAPLRGHARTVVTTPADWDEQGLRTVQVQARDRSITLTLPEARVTVRALRGAGLVRGQGTAAPTVAAAAAAARGPATFAGPMRRFLARGADPRVLVTCEVTAAHPVRPKQHGFAAPVVAAGFAGRRVVVLLDHGTDLSVEVLGRPLGGFAERRFERPGDPDTTPDSPPEPLVLVGRELLWRNVGSWWRIGEDGLLPDADVVAVGWSEEAASPRVLRREQQVGTAARAEVVLGWRRLVASTTDGRRWTLEGPGVRGGSALELDDGERVLGLTHLHGSAGVVTESATGQVVRFRSATARRTFTRLSGVVAHRSLHPTRPWLLVDGPDTTMVWDLQDDRVVSRVPRS